MSEPLSSRTEELQAKA